MINLIDNNFTDKGHIISVFEFFLNFIKCFDLPYKGCQPQNIEKLETPFVYGV